MIDRHVRIEKIDRRELAKPADGAYAVIWVTDGVAGIEVNGELYGDTANTVFFLHPRFDWKILRGPGKASAGYVMYLSDAILSRPALSQLHIQQVRILDSNSVHTARLAPGIEVRVHTVLEMLDELLSTHLNHREEAIFALINTFFVYCDGQCNIQSTIDRRCGKSTLVYKYKRLVNKRVTELQKVSDYADQLRVSAAYLNECTKEILGRTAKSLITEQLAMRARHALMFTDQSAKEIAYSLGFSSPDYFRSFCKQHIGLTPSEVKQA
ncbi:helix-turn-helix domain-containing protein [Lewinella sp. IMCC34191]|uniref:helix-turn-helix domain-containing protein n=1 Tax=Lewinella sp. IMCC34191 TaxID=2259172 RepID=UPI000E23DA0F|nr:helix-turn-helix domain-containing protein [Lewinella sp. IMCC34191]